MTSSICIDLLVNPGSSKFKQSTDANKNAINEIKKKRDHITQENDCMNDIVIFLFK